MTPLELSAKAQDVIRRVQKLLALANDERGNENQAASAAAKAQELLEAYNLDMAVVGQTAKGSQRSDTRLKGGLYKWQRYLWKAVAELNFCMYWSIKGTYKGQTYEHRILGRQENVIGAEVLADYLQQTIGRIAKETARERAINVFCREMIAFREGMATRLCQRLISLRDERLAEERRKQEEAKAGRSNGNGNGTSLILQSLIEDEDALNKDALFDLEPGTTMQRRRDAEAGYQQRIAERRQWELDNPEEHAANQARLKKENDAYWKKEEAKDRARERRREKDGYYDRESRTRRMTAEEARRGLSEFSEGMEVGDRIPLNQQVKDRTTNPKQIK